MQLAVEDGSEVVPGGAHHGEPRREFQDSCGCLSAVMFFFFGNGGRPDMDIRMQLFLVISRCISVLGTKFTGSRLPDSFLPLYFCSCSPDPEA